MKRIGIFAVLMTALVASAWSRAYDLKESEGLALTGIDRIVITVRSPKCVASIRTLNHDILVRGNDGDRRLLLSLSGTVRSNRRAAVPRLIWEKRGNEIHVSLYPDNRVIIGLVSRGKAAFEAGIPVGFKGEVEVETYSDNLELRDLSVDSLMVRVRSGNMDAVGISAGSAELRCGSGNIELDRIRTQEDLRVITSSGNVRMGEVIVGGKGTFDLSSGQCIGKTLYGEELEISNSSGDIEIEDAAARGTLSVMASSGRIDFGKTEAARIEIVSKSGNTRIGDLKGEIDVQSSSGNVTLGLRTLTGNVAVTCSSGNIRLTIPAGSRYSVDIEVKSGNVTLDDQVIGVVGQSRGEIRGDANGGGTLIMLRASSGNVSIVH